ncbi:putative iron sulfur assembly protein 1 [Rosellinia necatrix]|uniref:Iron-sulfur assembly protein 1 n=1 Tax=Rosellinia necatrix TaxID=77044 RepID=A0A1W2TUQ0_ROSNE|nr:putative iron sulfur assembly protein 1 [Rosellinia necatrix]
MVLRRGPGLLLNCLNAVTISSARPCLRVLRRFSQTQSWAAPENQQTPLPFQSYPLPSRLPSSPRNEPIPETPIANPIPLVHETRAPSQPETIAQPDKTLGQEAQKPKPIPLKRKLRPRKAALKLTPTAVEQLRQLLDQPEPKLIKVGVRNRGCSGLAYHLEYVDKPAAFDEEVEQDGVKVVIDSKALFSIIGSEMDWVEDKLNQRFIFRNPNIKEECGCGESFMV